MSETEVKAERGAGSTELSPRLHRSKISAKWLRRPQPPRADRKGVPHWKAYENKQAKPKTEELAKLWMNENSIVNQKAAYFTAVNGALFIALKDATDAKLATALFWVGVIVCIVAFISISRTCAYRAWLRHALEERDDYKRFFEVDFRWIWQRVKSSYLLTTVPLGGIFAWVYFTHLKVGTLKTASSFPCIFEVCWK